jgi:hypothetical protein
MERIEAAEQIAHQLVAAKRETVLGAGFGNALVCSDDDESEDEEEEEEEYDMPEFPDGVAE